MTAIRPSCPLWNFSSIGGTSFRHLASIALDAFDMAASVSVDIEEGNEDGKTLEGFVTLRRLKH